MISCHLPKDSYNLGFNFTYAYRHFKALLHDIGTKIMFGSGMLPVSEKISHASLGVLEAIPGLGHAVGYLDAKLLERKIKIIHLKKRDPYLMGIEHGKKLKDDIIYMVENLLPLYQNILKNQNIDGYKKSKDFEKHIPKRFIDEMKGISDASGIDYDAILLANTIVDIISIFGCSIVATIRDSKNNVKSLTATNHFPSEECIYPINADSYTRRHTLQSHSYSDLDSYKEALKKVHNEISVQSMIFDVKSCSLLLAQAGHYSADSDYEYYDQQTLFPNRKSEVKTVENRDIKLARNLDWPLHPLGRFTTVIVRPETKYLRSTASVSWPGMVGTFSGINDKGLSLAISVALSTTQIGMPNSLIFRKILEKKDTVEKTAKYLEKFKPTCGMNLVVAAKDGLAHFELNPFREVFGAAKATLIE